MLDNPNVPKCIMRVCSSCRGAFQRTCRIAVQESLGTLNQSGPSFVPPLHRDGGCRMAGVRHDGNP